MSTSRTTKPPTMPIEIPIYKPKIEDYKLKMLIYGPPGVGKTSLLATANAHPLTAPVLLINVESGILSVADVAALGLSEPPDVVDLKDFDQLESIFWFLAKGNHPYKSVAIDSLSELQMMNIEHIVQQQLGKPSSSSGAKRTSLDDVWLDDYGASTQQMRRLVRSFRDLPMHVFFSCHDAVSKDGDTIYPNLTPKLRTAVMGYMDVIGYMFTGVDTSAEGEEYLTRRLLCRPYRKWVAKDRSPGQKLGLVVDNPTIPSLINKILGKEYIK